MSIGHGAVSCIGFFRRIISKQMLTLGAAGRANRPPAELEVMARHLHHLLHFVFPWRDFRHFGVAWCTVYERFQRWGEEEV